MAVSTASILDVLSQYGIHPLEDNSEWRELPDIGEVDSNEEIYRTSLDEVFEGDSPIKIDEGFELEGDTRIREWWEIIRGIMGRPEDSIPATLRRKIEGRPPEPYCAWYYPLHFYGHSWGIYIRENCVLSQAIDISAFIYWPNVSLTPTEIARQLIRASFYTFFLHEHFHHKVESLGYRLLIASGSDRYRPYKFNVYRPNFLTPNCLEESLANADSYRRLDEGRYLKRLHPEVKKGLRRFLKASFKTQPPGYKEGIKYIGDQAFRSGLYNLQSTILNGCYPPITPPSRWSIAPNMITSLHDISENIYVVLPAGTRRIFGWNHVNPAITVSTDRLQSALTKHYGYETVPGGKGSHIKLKKPNSATIILPGNRPVLSPGVVKQALDALGGHPLSRLPDILSGKAIALV